MLGDTLRRSQSTSKPRPSRPPAPRRRSRITWRHWLLAVLLVPLVSFGVGYLLSTQVLFPAPETAGTGVPVPELYGMEWVDAQAAVESAGLAVGEIAELASMEAPEGEVLAQDPVPGQQLRPGGQVRLVVSAGPPSLTVPAVSGLGVSAARELLEASGFEVAVSQVASGLPEGVVARTDPPSGSPHALQATVTLLISAGPPQDTVSADTLSEVAWR